MESPIVRQADAVAAGAERSGQLRAAVAQAEDVAAYYRALAVAGLPEAVATELTLQYQLQRHLEALPSWTLGDA